MQGKIKVLKDVDKSNILPMTHAKAVYVDEETTLDKTLDDIRKGTVKVIDATESELIQLVENKQLVSGTYYRYTDWQYIHVYDTATGARHEGEVEPLTLKAISEDEFDSIVTSELYPNDIIYFDFNINLSSTSFPKRGSMRRRIDLKKEISLGGDWRHSKVVFHKPDPTVYYRGSADLKTYLFKTITVGTTVIEKDQLYLFEDAVYQGVFPYKVEKRTNVQHFCIKLINDFSKLYISASDKLRISSTEDHDSIFLKVKSEEWLPSVIGSTTGKIYSASDTNNTQPNVFMDSTQITLGNTCSRNLFRNTSGVVTGDNNSSNVLIHSSYIRLDSANLMNTIIYSSYVNFFSPASTNLLNSSDRNDFYNNSSINTLSISSNLKLRYSSQNVLDEVHFSDFEKCTANKIKTGGFFTDNRFFDSSHNKFYRIPEHVLSYNIGYKRNIFNSSNNNSFYNGCEVRDCTFDGSNKNQFTITNPKEYSLYITDSILKNFVSNNVTGNVINCQFYNCNGNRIVNPHGVSHTYSSYVSNKTYGNDFRFSGAGNKYTFTNIDNEDTYLIYYSNGSRQSVKFI